jgi:hypothetical protein
MPVLPAHTNNKVNLIIEENGLNEERKKESKECTECLGGSRGSGHGVKGILEGVVGAILLFAPVQVHAHNDTTIVN